MRYRNVVHGRFNIRNSLTKNLICVLSAVVLVSTLPSDSRAEDLATEIKDSTMRMELKDIKRPPTTDHPLYSLTLVVEAKQDQPIDSGGITFDLEIANGSTQDVEIMNPLDYMQILLVDEDGFPVKLPSAVPRALINIKGEIPDLPFRILKVVNSSGREVSLKETRNEVIKIPAESHYRATLEIDQIVLNSKREKPLTSKPTAIPAGDYRFRVIISLISAMSQKANRICISDYIKMRLGT